MYDLTEAKFQEALQLACSFFPIENLCQKLHNDQVQVLRKFFCGYDVFVSAHTGFGKSLVFQMIPIMADVFLDRLPGMSTVVVVSPLASLRFMTRHWKTRQGGLGTSAAHASGFITTRLRLFHNAISKFLRREDNAAVF